MKKLFAGIVVSCFLINVQAQNHEDIFRYSNQGLIGSARTLGLGGAWGAVGADASSASINPAGLGLFRRNELMGSLAITSTLSNADYLGNLSSDGRTILNIPNLGMVFTNVNQYAGKDVTNGVVSTSFALGMNRINNFQTSTNYSGINSNTSVANFLSNKANAAGYDTNALNSADFDNELYAQALTGRLILPTSANTYVSIFDSLKDYPYNVRQSNTILNKGRVNEWYAGGGVNISNFIYLGGSLVLQSANYSTDNTYSESVTKSSINSTSPTRYSSIVINQTVKTSGYGVGAKLGIIIRPVDFIKLGISYHTPVRLNLTDYYQNSMTMQYTNGASYNAPGREDYYKYQVVTPGRMTASGALTAGQIGVFTFDYERVDYSQGTLRANDGTSPFFAANENNKLIYDIAQNYRMGAEIKISDIRLRLGYSILGSPFKESVISKIDGTKQVISAGFGWIYDGSYFFDVAVNDRIGKDFITPYEGNPGSAVNTTSQINVVFGVGYRF